MPTQADPRTAAPGTADRPEVSVVVPTYRAAEHLRCCVRSLVRTRDPSGVEVAIYGDGGGEASRSALEACRELLARAGVREAIRYEPENLGITRALNRACALASGRWLFVVNDDMVFPARWWDRARPLLAAGRVLSTSAVEAPVPGRRMADCFHALDLGSEPGAFDFARLDAFQEDLPQVPPSPGVNYPFLIERELFFEVGGADERFPGPYHDPDLFLRLKLRGAELVRAGSIAPYHFSGASLRYGGERGAERVQTLEWVRRENEARVLFVRKWGHKPRARFGYVPRTAATEPWEGRPHGALATLRFRGLLAWEILRARLRERRYRGR